MKNKKIKGYFVEIILCSMLMFGCSADAVKTEEKTAEEVNVVKESVNEEQKTEVSIHKETPFVEVNGIVVKIGDDLSIIMDTLGEPDDLQTAKSCTGEGDEKVFTYGGISIYTTPSDNQDLVYILEVTGEEKLTTGIGLGSLKQDIIDTYGEDYIQDENYISYEYDEDGITLGFEFDGDTVSFIEIYGTL